MTAARPLLYGVGTLGRDMMYTLVGFYLVFYLTEVVDVPDATMWWITAALLSIRLADAFFDPVMGAIVDSTRSRWGPFRPWLAVGGLASAVLTVALFTTPADEDTGTGFVIRLGVLALAWGLAWSAHDIAYWGMLPALSLDRRERDRYAAVAKVFASLGQVGLVAGAAPTANALAERAGSLPAAWRWVAIGCSVLTVALLAVTIATVRERGDLTPRGGRTSLRDLSRAVFRNDQLLWVSAALLCFVMAYGTTSTFGLYYFKYVVRDVDAFPPFAIAVGVGQVAGLAAYPALSRRHSRGRLYRLATCAIVVAYAGLLFAPPRLVVLVPLALVLYFCSALTIVVLMRFQADTVEYGQLKLGRRNGAVTLAIQPFVNKTSAAVSTAIVSAVVLLSGVNDAVTPQDVQPYGLWLIRLTMFALPAVLATTGYQLWRLGFVVDEERHARIVEELARRGDLSPRLRTPE